MKAVKRFQSVALVTTAGLVTYYLLHEPETGSQSLQTEGEQGQRKQGHTLTGEVIDRDKQVKCTC